MRIGRARSERCRWGGRSILLGGVGGSRLWMGGLNGCLAGLLGASVRGGGGLPSFWSSLRPMSRKPTASIQAWLRRAMAS